MKITIKINNFLKILKNNNMKKKWTRRINLTFVVMACIFMGNFSVTSAIEENMVPATSLPQIEKNEMTVIADVNIRNAEISEIEKNHIKLVFDVENSMDIQSGLIYGLELVGSQENNKSIIFDTKIFSNDRITIEKGRTIKKEIEYQSPEYVNGEYTLWLKIKDESGLALALQPFSVSFVGSERFIEQGDPCYLTIEGEKNETYSLAQGVAVRSGEKLFLECQAKNLAGEEVTVLPLIEFYKRDFYGEKTGEYQPVINDVIIFSASEEKLIKIPIPLPDAPQAYDAKIVLKRNTEIFSNPTFAHFVVAGKSGTIINATLDKNQYKNGEKARLTVMWTGPADAFFETRTGASSLVNPIFDIDFRDINGKSCGEKTTCNAGELSTICELSMQNDCPYPQVTIKLSDEGQILYEKNITTKPDGYVKTTDENSKSIIGSGVHWSVMLPLVVISALGISLIWFKRKDKLRKNISTHVLFLMFFLSTLIFVNYADAKTVTLYEDPWWIGFDDPNFAAYGGAGIGVDVFQCKNVWPYGVVPQQCLNDPPTNQTYCYAKDRKTLWYNGVQYICYQTVVSFTYGLNKTWFNQGEMVTASGTGVADNMCNNGVAFGETITPKVGVGAQWLVNEPCVTRHKMHTSFGSSYSFSTDSWACGRYDAAFKYAFKHTCVSKDIMTDYTKAGSDTINYSIGNCCVNPTCATGPGCRATALVNGSVASGTCCSGMCYQCNPGYTWNGSMCTQNVVYACTGAIPSGGTMCTTDNTGLTANISWQEVATCTNTRKCEYTMPEAINGECGDADGNLAYDQPASNLCDTGTLDWIDDDPIEDGDWNWTCAGSGTGTTATCSANKQFVTPPTTTVNTDDDTDSDGRLIETRP